MTPIVTRPRKDAFSERTLLVVASFFITLACLAGAATPAAAQYGKIQTFTGVDGNPVTVTIKPPVIAAQPAAVSLNDPDLVAASATTYDLFVNAIKKVASLHANYLNIPTGTYDIQPPSTAVSHVDLSNLQDVVIDGEGSTLLFHNQINGILMRGSQRLVIKNLTIDWATTLAFSGVIHQSTSSATTLVIDPQYVLPSPAPVITIISSFDVANRQWPHTHNGIAVDTTFAAGKVLYQGNNTYLVPTSPANRAIPDGSAVIATVRGTLAAVMVYPGAADISLYNVTIYSSPGMGFLSNGADRGLYLEGCRVDRKPDSLLAPGEVPRLISTLSDACHVSAAHSDTLINNCTFRLQADDGLNIHNKLLPVTQVLSPTQIVAEAPDTAPTFDSDRPNSLVFYTTNFDPILNGSQPLIVTASVAKISLLTGSSAVDYTLNLSSPVSGLSTSLMVTNLTRGSSNYIIENSTFASNRARGALFRAYNGLVYGNVFTDNMQSGVMIMSECSVFREGPGANNLTFQNNVVQAANVAADSGRLNGQLQASLMVCSKIPSGYGINFPNQLLLIQNNLVDQSPGLAILLDSSTNVQLLNNQVTNANLIPFITNSPAAGSIMVTQSQGATISGNIRDAASLGLFWTSTASGALQPNY